MRSSRLLLHPTPKGCISTRPALPEKAIVRCRAVQSNGTIITQPLLFKTQSVNQRFHTKVLRRHDPKLQLRDLSHIFARSFSQQTARKKEESQKEKVETPTSPRSEEQLRVVSNVESSKPQEDADELDHDAEERGFGRSEKAAQASQVNLRARLSKGSKDAGKGLGVEETLRLVKIARPEARTLGWACFFLLISSSVSMTIPFSIGKFLDVATGAGDLYGFPMTTVYGTLAGIMVLGSAANYGRILLLRIVGERVVARMRSQLFRRTYSQDAEFFDANRVGDLISRLSSDTVIVGKSITQNLSDGLRSLVSGVGGVTLMAFVSLELTSILGILLPPIAVASFLFGRVIRNLSRQIQKNLGTLTKIAEERLGNVRTSQSFVGEGIEVERYHKQIKKLFDLGKREAFVNATYISTVRNALQMKLRCD